MPEFTAGKVAYLNIHWSGPNPRYDPTLPKVPANQERIWSGRAHTSLAQALGTMRWIGAEPGTDLYVCMSLQARMAVKTARSSKPYNEAVRFNTEVVSLRSIYMDIDVKPTAYATTSEAIAALKTFVVGLALPMPSALVKSGGGGFHVHWALEEALDIRAWGVLSAAMAAAAKDKGLMCDSQCTIDSVRLLRLPDTKNWKYDPPRDVELFSLTDAVSAQSLEEALADYITPAGNAGSHAGFTPGAPSAGVSGANDALGANLTTATPVEIKLADLVKACPYTARTLGTGGRDEDQPRWFLMATTATFLEDGRNAFHAMSDKHAGYSRQGTDDLYDRVLAARKSRDIGWVQCSKFAGAGAPECASCPLLKENKSPLNFASAPPPTSADLTLPDRYSRNAAGFILHATTNDDGSQKLTQICGYPITQGWLSNNPWCFHFATVTENGRKTDMEIPTEVVFQREGMAKYLGSKGMFCTENQYKMVKEFFVSWLQKLQGLKDSVISAAPFGWSVVDGKVEGFTYAGRVWMGSDDRPAANPNPVLAYQYTPKGDMRVWQAMSHIITSQGRPGLDAVLAVAFAGPLVRFTGFSGLILNSYSAESGIAQDDISAR